MHEKIDKFGTELMEYSIHRYILMLKTQLLSKIDSCLKSYVNQNNSRYKRSINTIFMDRDQLRNFYHDMQGEKQSGKLEEIGRKTQKIHYKKSKSCFIKTNKIVDWRNFEKVEINERPLISNFSGIKSKKDQLAIKNSDPKAKQSNFKLRIHEDPIYNYSSQVPTLQLFQFYEESQQISEYLSPNNACPPNPTPASKLPSNKQLDIEQMQLIRKQEQQKYINRYRLKLGKKQFKLSEDLKYENVADRSQVENSKNQEKINRKLSHCFQNFIDGIEHDIFREGNKEIEGIRKEIKRKDEISSAIQAYFIKNNRDFKLKTKSKENTLYQKFIQGKEQIQSQFKAHITRKNKNIVII